MVSQCITGNDKMEKLPFSEFSYGFSFTENMMRSDSIVPDFYPIHPSLRAEADLGYDIEFRHPGAILYFQFKIPKMLKTNRALETNRNRFNIGDLYPPFLRMPIMSQTTSNQHNTLISWEKKKIKENKRNRNKRCSFVFYATPMFSDSNDLNANFQSASVHLSSALFSPLEIDYLRPGDYHSIAYNLGVHYPQHGWMCSNTPNRWKFLLKNNVFHSEVKPIKIYRYSRIIRAVNCCLKRSERHRTNLLDAIDMELNSIDGYMIDERPIIRRHEPFDGYWRESEVYNRLREAGKLRYVSPTNIQPSDGGRIRYDREMSPEMRKLIKLQQAARSYFNAELFIFQRR